MSLLHEFFSAHEQLKGILHSLPLEQASPPSSWQQWAPAAKGREFRQSRLTLGGNVLGHFPPLPLCNDLVRAYFDGFHQIRPVVPRHWVGQVLNEVFQLQGLAEPRTADGIDAAAARIDYGSENSLLNWNTVGVLLSMFAMAAYTTPQLLDIGLLGFHEGMMLADEIRAFAFKMHDLVGVCWQLTDPYQRADESLVLLLYFYFMLLVVFGEYSKHHGLRIYIRHPSKQTCYQYPFWSIFMVVSSTLLQY